MLDLHPTSGVRLDDREAATAVLHIAFPGGAPPGEPQTEWLYERLLQATSQALAIGSVRREMRTAFPHSANPDRAVRRLLEYPMSHTYVSWQRRGDGVRVYVGETPCTLSLPVGQDPHSPRFDINDWMFSVRAHEPVPA